MLVEIANRRWWGKRSRHSQRMRNPAFHLSGKRPIVVERLVALCSLDLTRVLARHGWNFICSGLQLLLILCCHKLPHVEAHLCFVFVFIPSLFVLILYPFSILHISLTITNWTWKAHWVSKKYACLFVVSHPCKFVNTTNSHFDPISLLLARCHAV